MSREFFPLLLLLSPLMMLLSGDDSRTPHTQSGGGGATFSDRSVIFSPFIYFSIKIKIKFNSFSFSLLFFQRIPIIGSPPASENDNLIVQLCSQLRIESNILSRNSTSTLDTHAAWIKKHDNNVTQVIKLRIAHCVEKKTKSRSKSREKQHNQSRRRWPNY